VTFDGRPIALTPKEHDLLVYLARDPDTVLTREQIIEAVWDENWFGSTKTLDVHVASLRKKLTPEIIENVRGVGFRLVAGSTAP
jgi:DNA-binding response OmpR family regulator